MSHDLDEACALAMGWRDIGDDADGCQCGLPPERAAGVYRRRFVPAYSTDAACIPELMAWFKAQEPRLFVAVDELTQEFEATCHASFDDPELVRHRVYGDTLSEALAKLVAAVGDAKRNAE